ncbi:zinc finger CCCH-type containing 7Ba isoform X2 [Melanotaenia boesemani]|uniref:zinc finger CCCH-type containing 7Ba isoform X2 n=1 Tax=Melanotaenia boesemani TaxID=1250792 RepID=UPI001C056358|nr:zinc finger CCCH-type containing 7Ba isoform X2 [Melanotaenia boesemani]
MDPARNKRREEISKALAFIQSPLAYPDSKSYQDYLTQLVCNLLEEGNAFFRDREWVQAIREFTEGLNVSLYAEGEDIQIPKALLESLYVNRAAAHHSMGKYDKGVEDCNSALEVCKESRRALYRKALCLKELEKYKEAYDCMTSCLLSAPQLLTGQTDERARTGAGRPPGNENSETICQCKVFRSLFVRRLDKYCSDIGDNLGNGLNSASSAAPVNVPSVPKSHFASTPPVCSQPASSVLPDTVDDSELMGDDLDSLLDSFPNEEEPSEAAFAVPSRKSTSTHTAPSVLPAPTPQLPPAFFNSAINQLNSLDSFSNGGYATSSTALDILDDLSVSGIGRGADASNSVPPSSGLDTLDALDSLDSLDEILDGASSGVAAEKVNKPKTELDVGEKSLNELLDEVDILGPVSNPSGQRRDVPKISTKATEQLDCLDALDLFPTVKSVGSALPAVSFGVAGLDSLSDFSSNGFSDSHTAFTPVMRSPKNHYKERNSPGLVSVSNPLASTHEFLQACSTCFPQEGKGIYSYVHKPDLVHNCKRDILLCRWKVDCPTAWTRVRPLPARTSFSGPFVLCKNLLQSGDLGICKYGEKCTFAYNQLEIDVWTEERKGTLDRNLLFETTPVKMDPVNSIIQLQEENKGMFIFLCQECYDSKPRIISKRSSDNHAICSNVDARHNFDANKCLAFVMRTFNVNYKKVRPLSIMCQLDLCRQAIRYGCQREDSCQYAHSVIELKTWRIQCHTGISPDEIVKVSMKYHDKTAQNSNKDKVNRVFAGGGGSKSKGGEVGGARSGKTLNMKMKFACAQCWGGGLITEPDKALKYCSAKASHMWTKDRRVLLVKSSERSKWVQVRPLPHAKNFPVQYDMCAQIQEKRKCNYTGNCTFAHSQEEKEMWMYMKNNDLRDMQQVYDMWLTLAGNHRQAEGATFSQPNSEEKCIIMPTDYAEPMYGFHCRLCGKHSNSERQWQQHISSEKHKDRVFSCEGEDEALTWSYRFPGTCFKLCPKFDGGCPDGVSCDYAHSPEELQEWTERRDFLRQKLAKARDDMLVMPNEFDFGKYNFLLQD